MRVGICFILLCIAACSAIPNTKLCALDEHNACRDYSTAARCHTTNFCKAEVWSKPANNNSRICQLCLDDMKNLQQFITAKSTKKFVRNDLLLLCEMRPFAPGRNRCKTLVEEKFDEIYQDIVEKLDPNMICQALYLCRSSNYREVMMNKIRAGLGPLVPLQPNKDVCQSENKCKNYATAKKCGILPKCKKYVWMAPAPTDSPLCDYCKLEIQKLHDWAANKTTEAEIKKDLLMFCDNIPVQTLQQECHNLVDQDFDSIYEDIVNGLDANVVCTALGLCQPSLPEELARKTCDLDENNACFDYSTAAKCKTLNYCRAVVWTQFSQEGKLCNICRNHIDRVQKFLDANSTREFIESELLTLCKFLPMQKMRYRCQTTVIQNFEDIYNDIVSFMNASRICKALRFCRQEMLPALEQEQKETDPLDSRTRYMCSNLDSLNACRDYGTAKKCDRLKQCKEHVWTGLTDNGDKICHFCINETGKIQKWVENTTTKAEVEKKIHALCDAIPLTAFRDACNQLVEENFEQIYDDIIAMLDPDTICKALRLCTSVSVEGYVQGMLDNLPGVVQAAMEKHNLPIAAPFDPNLQCGVNTNEACYDYSTAHACNALETCKLEVWSHAVEDNDGICDMCKKDIAGLQEKFNNTRENVRKSLNNFCMKIRFSGLRNSCLSLVKKELDVIYDDIIYLMNPKAICAAFRLCAVPGDKKALPAVTETGQQSCTGCESFMRSLENLALSNKEVLNGWLNMLKVKCKTTDDSVLCAEYVDMMFYQAIMLRRSNEDASVKPVCKALGMCDVFHVKMVGDICTDCKTFFKEWQEELKDNPDIIDKTVQAVSDFYCLQKPKSVREQCAKYVSMVIKVLIVQLENEDVAKICTRFQLCDQVPETSKALPDFREFAKKVSKMVIDSMPKLRKRVGGDMCTDCQNFMTDLQTEISNNSTVIQDLVNLVKTECKQFGGELGDLCVVYVNDHYEEILKEFNSYDVGTICKAIRMCGTKLEKLGGDICTDCVAFFGDWKNIIANNQSFLDDDLKAMKQAICSGVPFFLQGECDKVFDEEAAMIIKAIQQTDANTICTDLYFCKPKEENTLPAVVEATLIEPAKEKAEIPVVCQLCEDVMKYVDSMIDFNSTEEEILDALDKACDYLPKYGDQCRNFVQTYGKTIVDLILKEGTSPTLVCEALALCSTKQESSVDQKGHGTCAICQAVMRYVDAMIDYNSTEAQIKKALDEACGKLGQYKEECQSFVDNYGVYIIHLILKEATSPSAVCKSLMLCDARPKETVVKNTRDENPVPCQLCKDIMTYVNTMVNVSSTEKEIKNALDRACDRMEQYKKQCRAFVDQYAMKIIDFVLKEATNPDFVCKALGLCNSDNSLKAVKNIPQKKLKGEAECDFCLAIFTEVDKILGNQKTENEIVDALSKVCSYMGKYQDECNTLIHEYLPTIIELISQDVSPSEICDAIKLCTASAKKTVEKIENKESDTLCDVCTLIAEELDNILKDNATTAEIENALRTVCSVFSGDMKTKCDQLIDQYWPQIIDFLVKEMAPEKICTQLGLCTQDAKVSSKERFDTSTCDICQYVAGALDDLLKDNATKAEIQAALEEVCSILPSQYKDECNNLLQQYYEAIMEILIEEMNPKVICADLKLCPKSGMKKVSDGPLCQVCQNIAEALDGMLENNATQKKIEDALETVCSILPTEMKQQCDDILKTYYHNILNMLIHEMNHSLICVQLRLCSRPQLKLTKKVTASPQCVVCQLIAETLETLLKDNATKQEIEEALEKVCGLLPEQYRDQCNTIVQDYYQTIVQLLIQEMDPSVICVQLGLCDQLQVIKKTPNGRVCDVCKMIAGNLHDMLANNQTEAAIEQALEMVCKLVPQAKREACESIISQYYEQFMVILLKELDPNVICSDLKLCPKQIEVKKTPNGRVCDVCKMIAQNLHDMLANNQTEAAIEQALEMVCKLVPQAKRDMCENIISQYYEQFVAILMKELDPNVICSDLKLCPKQIEVKKDSPETVCLICKLVANELDKLLEQDSTREQIVDAVGKVCGFLPESMQDQCSSFIENYGDDIVRIILVELTPERLCRLLRLCPAPSIAKQKDVNSVAECGLCEVVMEGLKTMLNEKSTEEEILNAVNSVCNVIPQQYRSECHLYVNDYGPGIIALLADDFSPSSACVVLHACSSSEKMKIKTRPMKIYVNKDDEECDVCKRVIEIVDEILKDNYTEEALEKALQQVCSYMPAALVDECDAMVAQYAPMIFQYIDQIGDPSFICQHLKLCPTDSDSPPLLGGDKCTYGPSYWCRDMETASACNAVQHCRDHVW